MHCGICPKTAAFYLVDVGDTAGPLSLGSALSIHNTSCVLTQPTVSVSGNLETMNFLITFSLVLQATMTSWHSYRITTA